MEVWTPRGKYNWNNVIVIPADAEPSTFGALRAVIGEMQAFPQSRGGRMSDKVKEAVGELSRIADALPCEYPEDPCATAKGITHQCTTCDLRSQLQSVVRTLQRESGIP